MMADKNNKVRVLGYEDNGLILTTGEYDATGQSYYTDFAYASTASYYICLLYTSPSPRDRTRSRMPSSA